MNQISTLSSAVDFEFDTKLIDARVDIFKVTSSADYADTCRLIREALSPISLVRSADKKTFVIMREKSGPDICEDENLAVRQVSARNVMPELPRLAARAVPALLGEIATIETDTRFAVPFPHSLVTEKTGLVTCWRPEIFSLDQHGRPLEYPYLSIEILSFLRLSSIKDEGYRDHLAKKNEHYFFGDEFLGRAGLKKVKMSEAYVKKSLFKGKRRAQHIALDLTDDSLRAFYDSRSGFYARFLGMLEDAWGDSVKITLRMLKGTLKNIGHTAVTKRVQERLEASPKSVSVFVGVKGPDLDAFLDAFIPEICRHTEPTWVTDVREADIILTPTENVLEVLAQKDILDPSLGRKPGSQIITIPQSFYDEKPLTDSAIKSIASVVLNELIVKSEVMSGHIFSSEHKNLPDFHAFYKDPDGPDFVHAEVIDGRLILEMKDQDSLESIFGPLLAKHVVLIDGVKICIESTQLRALPDVIKIPKTLKALAGGGNPTAEVIPLEDVLYAARVADIPLDALPSLNTYLSVSELKKFFPIAGKAEGKHVVSKDLAANKRLAETLMGRGWCIRAGVQQKDKGLFGAMNGIFITEDQGLYFAGFLGSPQTKVERFPVAKRIKATGSIPAGFFDLFDDVTIRHKQTTVYPFIFKHMREYLKLLKLDTQVDDWLDFALAGE